MVFLVLFVIFHHKKDPKIELVSYPCLFVLILITPDLAPPKWRRKGAREKMTEKYDGEILVVSYHFCSLFLDWIAIFKKKRCWT